MKNGIKNEIKVHECVCSNELEIRHDGTIWRLSRRTFCPSNKKRGLKHYTPKRAERLDRDGYLQVHAVFDGVRYCATAHRLVWFHFNGLIPEGLTINHKNGIRTDNRPENLELATRSYQRKHSIHVLGGHVPRLFGSRNPKSIVTESQVIRMRSERKRGIPAKILAERYGMSVSVVHHILSGRSWKTTNADIDKK